MKKLIFLLLALFFGAFILVMTPGCTKDLVWPEEVSTPSGGSSSGSSSSDDDDDDDDDDDSSSSSSSSDEDNSSDEDSEDESDGPVIKIAWSSSSVSVSGDDAGIVSASGAYVTVNYSGDEEVTYELSGSSSSGAFKLYSSKKQVIKLAGLSLTNPNGAAINVQSGKKVTVKVSGTNSLADGSSYADSGDEDMKAAFFSEGQLIFKGSGSLSVTAKGKNGIHSDDFIRITGDGPSITVTSSAGHGIVGKDSIRVKAGTIKVTTTAASKKAMRSDGPVFINGGSLTLSTSGGVSYDSDDAEYKGAAGIKAGGNFTITGGSVEITSTGQGGKGISGDAIGYFKGGEVTVKVSGSNYGSSSSGGPGGGGGPGRWSVNATSSDNSVAAKGIKFDGNLVFSGATVSATSASHEGIESKGTITISGGTVVSVASDDAINSAGDFTISGGYVYAHGTGNDGLDANGNFYIKGGVIFAVGTSSPELGIDANTEGGKKLYISGGTIIAIGGIESGSSLSQPIVTSSSWAKSTNYALYSGNDVLMAFKTPASGGSSMVMSVSGLKSGSKYTLKQGVSISDGTSVFGTDTALFYSGATVSGGSGSNTLTATTSSNGR